MHPATLSRHNKTTSLTLLPEDPSCWWGHDDADGAAVGDAADDADARGRRCR